VLIKFDVDEDVTLGDRTEAAIKTKSLLGSKVLDVTPRGEGQLSQPIPLERTRPAYQLPDALGDLAATINGRDTDQLNNSLATLAQTFQDTPPDLQVAVAAVARFSRTLDERDAQLRGLLANANKATAVLAVREFESTRSRRDSSNRK
jgi:phospholipid/cholesterol/gamma-HCH transport system substrate-binding protein